MSTLLSWPWEKDDPAKWKAKHVVSKAKYEMVRIYDAKNLTMDEGPQRGENIYSITMRGVPMLPSEMMMEIMGGVQADPVRVVDGHWVGAEAVKIIVAANALDWNDVRVEYLPYSRVEIRKTLSGSQLLLVVTSREVKMSMNGPCFLIDDELDQLRAAVEEAREALTHGI